MKSTLMELWMIVFGLQLVIFCGIKVIIINKMELVESTAPLGALVVFGMSIQYIGLYYLDKKLQYNGVV